MENVGPRGAVAPSVVRSSEGRRAVPENLVANPGNLPLPVEGGYWRARRILSQPSVLRMLLSTLCLTTFPFAESTREGTRACWVVALRGWINDINK